MHLELTETDARALESAVALQLRQMREDLARTDDRAYRAGLRAAYDRLEDVYRHIEQLLARADAFA